MESGFAERRQQLVELVDYPRENLSIEIKNWIDLSDAGMRAHVARELLALGNNGGGYLIFGFEEEDSGYAVAEPLPTELSPYSQDAVNSIIARYAEPVFEVEVEFVARSDQASTHPVVVVPSDLDVPVRASRDGPEQQHIAQHTYYVRRPGPESAPIGTGREWDELLDRCIRTKREDLIGRLRDIVQGPGAVIQPEIEEDEDLDNFIRLAHARFSDLIDERELDDEANPYSHGTWHLGYRVIRSRELTTLQLKDVLQQVVGHETGWPAWWWPTNEDNIPRPWNGRIECWMIGGYFADSAHSDYWLADPQGMLFLQRGYEDDSGESGAPREPGTKMDLVLPTWRIGECLLHAERFAAAVVPESETSDIDFAVEWKGLSGRQLTTWASPNRILSPHPNRGQDVVRSRLRVPAHTISEHLPDLVKALVGPLYESFDFFQPPDSMYREELDALRGRSRRQ